MSKYNWPELIKDFEHSDLNQSQFCKEKNINPKYFNLKYSQHRAKADQSVPFIKAERVASDQSPTLMIHVGRCTVVCPETMPVQSFVSLVHQLA